MTFDQKCEFALNVNISALPSLPYAERRNLPECFAIYFLMDGNHVVYVGSTKNLRKLWIHHSLKYYGCLRRRHKIAWLLLDKSLASQRYDLEYVMKVRVNPDILGQGGKGFAWHSISNHMKRLKPTTKSQCGSGPRK